MSKPKAVRCTGIASSQPIASVMANHPPNPNGMATARLSIIAWRSLRAVLIFKTLP
jgi:hypothetical protein